jgi:hypothetical protein
VRNAAPVTLVVLLTLVIVGCTNSDDRLVEMAREDAARQPGRRSPCARAANQIVPTAKAVPR